MAGGGPITAAAEVPGGPILAGDHRRRDTVRSDTGGDSESDQESKYE